MTNGKNYTTRREEAPRRLRTRYEGVLADVLERGDPRMDRTGTGTYSMFSARMVFDLWKEFPLVTTKEVHFHSVVTELLWFMQGRTNVEWLRERGVRIWNEWADENGDLGPVYGAQWRSWPTPDGGSIDQLTRVIEQLKTDPYSRRHIVSAWNVAALDEMALVPCHLMFQFYIEYNGRLSCQVYQRSADLFLGVPFNIASYALLTHIVAKELGRGVGRLIWVGGDCHIYMNHLDQVREQLNRDHRPGTKLHFRRKNSIFDYEPEDFVLMGYDPHPKIVGEVAV